MTLEDQVKALSDNGLHLNEGVTIKDLLASFSRQDYENDPFDLILFVYGIELEEEPWGRYFSDQAWNFDVEAIEDHGSYVDIVRQFHRITGKTKAIEGLTDHVDIEAGEASLTYTIDGQKRNFRPTIDNDWADAKVIEAVLNDLKGPGHDFYPKDNGQASVWFYLTSEQASAINGLADNVFNLTQKPWWKFW